MREMELNETQKAIEEARASILRARTPQVRYENREEHRRKMRDERKARGKRLA